MATFKEQEALKAVQDLGASKLQQIFYLASKEAKVALRPGTQLEQDINDVLAKLREDYQG